MNKRIVVEIDEDIYQGIKESDFAFARNAVRSFQATIADAIRKSTPLDAEVVKALEDVRAEVEAMYGVTDLCDGSIRVDKYEVLVSIERKIKEYTHETR